MKLLPYPDRFYWQAAEGWLLLGESTEAAYELSRISRRWVNHPDYLQLSCRVHIAQKNWRAALEVSERQIMVAPDRPQAWINRAYCLHELRRTKEALRALLPAARRFPRHEVIAFNLACYCCHLNEYPQALRWINRTISLANPRRGLQTA